MPDLTLVPAPPRADLIQQLRLRLAELLPGSRLIAVNLMGAEATIDFVALEPGGAVVLVLVGAEGEDLELVGRALAQRAWVEARLRDWLQLAPDLGVRPEAGARVLLLCPSFRPETRAAAETLGTGALGLVQYRCVRNGAGIEALVESVSGASPQPPSPSPSPSLQLRGAPRAARPSPSPFRTGLSDADLGFEPGDEVGEFE